jgi:formylglycine-generating enzyme required for sulfatase activity
VAKLPAGWKEYSPEGGGFTVALPPGKSSDTREAFDTGTVKFQLPGKQIDLPTGGGVRVVYGELPRELRALRPEEVLRLLSGARGRQLKDGRVTGDVKVQADGYPGRDVTFLVPVGPNGEFIRQRAYVVKDRVYVLTLNGDPTKVPAQDFRTFFDSFRLTAAGPQPVQGPRPEAPPPPKRERPLPLDCTGPAGLSAAQVQQSQKAWADYLGRQVEDTIDVGNGVKMTFVLIPPGKFLMGSPQEEQNYVINTYFGGKMPDWWSGPETQHKVTLTEPFDMAKTEMTQAQYEAVMGDNPSRFKGADRPVEQVSWTEARGCADRLTIKRGDKHVYRLPTEAEWEYSCRGGRSSSQPFGIGDGRSLSSLRANFNGNIPYGGAAKGPSLQSTCRVGCYAQNALGLYDMHGNVFEWCADWYGPYPVGDVTNPRGASEGSNRVWRGGSWNYNAGHCRAADRGRNPPGVRWADTGLRLARSVPSGVQ